MFIGSIPAPLRSIVHEHTADWGTQEVWVGCSGNLTVERAVEDRFKLIHSNDVSLYTSCLASWLAGTPFKLEIAEEHLHDFGWLMEYLEKPVDQVATIMQATQALVGLGKENPYYVRMRDARRRQWPTLHAKTVDKLEKVTLRLASYTCGDVMEYVDSIPDGGAVIAFPPFYESGYEALYRAFGEVFVWDEPEYEIMDAGGLHVLLDKMREKKHWLYATDHRIEEQEEQLRAVVQPSLRNVKIYVYGSSGDKRVAMPRTLTKPVTIPRLGPDEEVGERMSLAKLDAQQFAALRSKYLNPAIVPAAPRCSFAVLVDGKMVGCLGLLDTQGPGQWVDVYLNSDFPIAPTKHKRLSKLVLTAALSHEFKLLVERELGRRSRTIGTTAFTDRPVSMKYRGLFRLHKRMDDKDGPFAFKLNYASDMGRWSLSEGLATWKEQHGAT